MRNLTAGLTISCGCRQSETGRANAAAAAARRARRITHNGITLTIAEWAQLLGIHPESLRSRLSRSWPLRDALTLPPSPGRRKDGGIAPRK
jgi:hypothetical protein